MKDYKVVSYTIDGYNCIEHKAKDWAIACRWGEVYAGPDATCFRVCIFNNRIINKHSHPREPYKEGEERIITIPRSELSFWLNILDYPKFHHRQLTYANSR